jgi:hypothetical protein
VASDMICDDITQQVMHATRTPMAIPAVVFKYETPRRNRNIIQPIIENAIKYAELTGALFMESANA